MECGHNKVSCLGCGNGGTDSIKVTHLTDEDNVRVFTESGTESVGEGKCILVNFSLVDHCLTMLVKVLDGLLKSKDVALLNGIDVTYHCGKGRGLTGTRRTGNKDKTTGS